MEKLNLFLIVSFLIFLCGCNIFNSSDEEQSFKYKFQTYKTKYSIDETVVSTFVNQSNQSVYLSYQACTIVDLGKRTGEGWKSISIPIVCPAVVRGPVEVKPGAKKELGVSLHFFEENELEIGVYRLNVVAHSKGGEMQDELNSNSFRIVK